MMSLEEAIKHCEEVAEKQEITAKSNLMEIDRTKVDGILRLYDADEYESCMKCASEHRQLAEWLRELKAYRENENCNKPYWAEMEILPNAYDIMGVKTWASKMRCSNCDFITYAIEGKFSQYNYCPQCGKQIGAKYEEVNNADFD